MNLLALDTSTEACSCALSIAGELRERSLIAPRRHAELILPMADELLAEAGMRPQQLDGLAFSCGPGSFTGLRIACGVAQGIAFAADIPVAPISSLATLAQAAPAQQVLAAIDARMHEVYWGQYIRDADGLMRLMGEESVCAPQQVKPPATGTWYGVGSGWLTYISVLQTVLGDKLSHCAGERYPQAQAMIPLALAAFANGHVVTAEYAVPVYLRNKVVSCEP